MGSNVQNNLELARARQVKGKRESKRISYLRFRCLSGLVIAICFLLLPAPTRPRCVVVSCGPSLLLPHPSTTKQRNSRSIIIMSDEQIDDSEFFHQDFTTASEWEVFNARLEEQIHEWRLPHIEPGVPLQRDELSLCPWTVTNETITFADVEFRVSRYQCTLPAVSSSADDVVASVATNSDDSKTKPTSTQAATTTLRSPDAFVDLITSANNYALPDERSVTANSGAAVTPASSEPLPPLARWYGLRDFVVVAPVRKPITNESQIRILLSSLHIAIAESGCAVPVFLQAMETRQNVYSGVAESRTHRLSFDVVHLRHVPPTYKYLTGLLDMFKSKVDMSYVNPVQVSVRLAFALTRFPPMLAAGGTELDFETADMLEDAAEGGAGDARGTDDRQFRLAPFRVSIDPMTELRLYALWPQVADNVVIDSQNYTDFDALRAPVWRVRCRFEAPTICRMSECLGEFVQRHDDQHGLADLLGNGFNMLGDESERNPFDILTESKITTVLPSFGLGGGGRASASAASATTSKRSQGPNKLDGPLHDELLMQMLYYMFPDAQRTDVPAHAYVIPDDDPVSTSRISCWRTITHAVCQFSNRLIRCASNRHTSIRWSIAWPCFWHCAMRTLAANGRSPNCGRNSRKKCVFAWSAAFRYRGECCCICCCCSVYLISIVYCVCRVQTFTDKAFYTVPKHCNLPQMHV